LRSSLWILDSCFCCLHEIATSPGIQCSVLFTGGLPGPGARDKPPLSTQTLFPNEPSLRSETRSSFHKRKDLPVSQYIDGHEKKSNLSPESGD
jgi:hypothetical protein